jgi:hypothetical protein
MHFSSRMGLTVASRPRDISRYTLMYCLADQVLLNLVATGGYRDAKQRQVIFGQYRQ